MKRDEIVDALNSEIARLTSARDLLLGAKDNGEIPGRLPTSSKTKSASNTAEPSLPKRRSMSAEGKARIAAAQRKRWAKQKSKGGKATQSTAKTAKRPATPAKNAARNAAAKAASKRSASRKSPIKRQTSPAAAAPAPTEAAAK